MNYFLLFSMSMVGGVIGSALEQKFGPIVIAFYGLACVAIFVFARIKGWA